MDFADAHLVVKTEPYDVAATGQWPSQPPCEWPGAAAAAATIPVMPLVVPRYVPAPAVYRQRPHIAGVTATLVNADLWTKFDRVGNEMIVTKKGRSIFPRLAISVQGLDPDAEYSVLMEMRLAAPTRFKYHAGRWVASGAADAQHSQLVYVHPDSPAKGATWTAKDITFRRSNNAESAKLTNSTQATERNNLVLTSMHKYRPMFHIVRASDHAVFSVDFPETEFVAVTAYQNEAIKSMKINNNPFAKGFRDSGLSHRNRRDKDKLRMGAEEVLREAAAAAAQDGSPRNLSPPPSPGPSPTSHLSLHLTSTHDDSGVSSVGSAPPSPASSMSSTPPPTPSPAEGSSSGGPGGSPQPGFLSIAAILDPSFGPQQHRERRVPPCHDDPPMATSAFPSPPPSATLPAATTMTAVPADVEPWTRTAGPMGPVGPYSYMDPYPYAYSGWGYALPYRYQAAPALTSGHMSAVPQAFYAAGYATLQELQRVRMVDEEMPKDLSTSVKRY